MGQGGGGEGREDMRWWEVDEDNKEWDVVDEGGAGERDGMQVLQEDRKVDMKGNGRALEGGIGGGG